MFRVSRPVRTLAATLIIGLGVLGLSGCGPVGPGQGTTGSSAAATMPSEVTCGNLQEATTAAFSPLDDLGNRIVTDPGAAVTAANEVASRLGQISDAIADPVLQAHLVAARDAATALVDSLGAGQGADAVLGHLATIQSELRAANELCSQ